MFCNQCGTQVPDNSTVCSNCGAVFAAPQAAPQPMMQQGQPMMQQGQPMMQQGQPMMQGQPMYNGQPMQGYGMPQQPQSNPLEFLTKKYPDGQPFAMNGVFSKKNLMSKFTTIDLMGVIAALIAFISVFLPFISYSGWGEKDSRSLISGDMTEVYGMGWAVLFTTLIIMVLYALRFEFMAFLASCLNFVFFISVWTFGASTAKGTDAISLGVGFWFYLIASFVLVLSPFIWKLIKKHQ